MFNLTEEIFLLSLYEKKKSIVVSSNKAFPFALAGAILLDLIFLKRIKVVEGKFIALVDYELSGDKRLDETLDEIVELNKQKRITFWINALEKRGARNQKSLMKSMITKKVLEENKEHNWAIPYSGDDQAKASEKFRLKARLRNIVFGDEPADLKTTALFSLLSKCNLLGFVFTDDEIKAAAVKIDVLVNREEIGTEMIENLQSIKNAIESVIFPDIK